MVKPYSSRGPRGRAAASTADLTAEIATTRDGNDITRPLTRGLQPPRDPRLNNAVDWGIYNRILLDEQVFSTLQQRRTAVVSRNWNVLPGDENDPRSVEAADKFSQTLKRICWDRITDKMLFAIFHGYAVAEVIWEAREGLLDFGQIKVRHARRFRYTDAGELRFMRKSLSQGEPVPDRKFWVFTVGGSDDDEFYGRGLAEWLYWPTLFKRNGLRFWNTFLDKFGSPTAIGKFRPGTPAVDQAKLLDALMAMATDSGIVVPESMQVALLEAARSGTADYAVMVNYMDSSISKVVLSQTMTTDNGSSRAQGQVHADVKLEVIKSDADLLSDSFNGENGPARWWTDVNYGPDVASPIVHREVEEEADTKVEAETDVQLKSLGWVRTEESFRETYGEGYERAPEPAKAAAPTAKPGTPGALPAPANDPAAAGTDPAKDPAAASFAANDPRPLYVYRPLINASDLVDWARQNGFNSTLPPEDMHVTITYSKRAVNWMKMGDYWGNGPDSSEHLVPPGGVRMLERFGNAGDANAAIVLVFYSGHLEWRHDSMVENGASWDHSGYYPHVTITYDGADLDLAAIEPYRGELRFGPEIFEPIVDDWQSTLQEASFAAPAGPPVTTVDGKPVEVAIADAAAADIADDATDQLVDQLVAESGYRAARALTEPMIAAAMDANSADELLAKLAAASGDDRPLGTSLENASFALRLAEENGDQTV